MKLFSILSVSTLAVATAFIPELVHFSNQNTSTSTVSHTVIVNEEVTSGSTEWINRSIDDKDINVQLQAFFASLSEDQNNALEADLFKKYHPASNDPCSLSGFNVWEVKNFGA